MISLNINLNISLNVTWNFLSIFPINIFHPIINLINNDRISILLYDIIYLLLVISYDEKLEENLKGASEDLVIFFSWWSMIEFLLLIIK